MFRSSVLPPKQVTTSDRAWRDLAYRAWRRNAAKELVTFSFDEQDSLIGVIEVPAATLDREELQLYVETLAKECDRFEYRRVQKHKRTQDPCAALARLQGRRRSQW